MDYLKKSNSNRLIRYVFHIHRSDSMFLLYEYDLSPISSVNFLPIILVELQLLVHKLLTCLLYFFILRYSQRNTATKKITDRTI